MFLASRTLFGVLDPGLETQVFCNALNFYALALNKVFSALRLFFNAVIYGVKIILLLCFTDIILRGVKKEHYVETI